MGYVPVCVCVFLWVDGEEHGIASFLIDVCFITDFIWSTVVDHGIASLSLVMFVSVPILEEHGIASFSLVMMFVSVPYLFFLFHESPCYLDYTLCTHPAFPSFRL